MKGEEGVSHELNIGLQSSYQMVMFCRSKDREQISGKEKQRLREASVNGTCFRLCATVLMTSMYVAKVKKHDGHTEAALPSQHNERRVSNSSMIVGHLVYTSSPVSGNMNVQKALKFSV